MNKSSQIQFAFRCAILLESGISLCESLSIIASTERSKKNRAALNEIHTMVSRGIPLARSIEKARIRFDETLLSMVAFGESSGILAPSLRQALDILEKNSQTKKKIIGALIYPAFIASATVAMTLFLVMYIFPKIIPLFLSMNVQLPLITRIVRSLYLLLSSYGLFLLAGLLIFFGIGLLLYRKKQQVRMKAQLFLLTIPLLGQILQKFHVSSCCRSLATLLECGQTLPNILRQISESSSLDVYRRALGIFHDETVRGVPLSASLRSFGSIFPQIVPDMLSIGERTGSLASMARHVSRMYEEEIDSFTKKLSTLLEPILMIGMGLVVGSVALSIILPIYEITNHLQK